MGVYAEGYLTLEDPDTRMFAENDPQGSLPVILTV